MAAPLKVLITNAGSRLGRGLTPELRAAGHELRLSHRSRIRTDCEFVQSQLGHGSATDRLVSGIGTIVHIPDPGPQPAAEDWIDAGTRRAYNLFLAAAEAGVGRLIYISTLDLFLPYDEEMVVGETWRPLPSTDPEQLGTYLGEFVAEEFAQEGRFACTCLRLGHLVEATEAEGQPYDPMWLELSDAARAIAAAVGRSADAPAFEILHLQSSSPRSRFRIDSARTALGFEPRHNFA